MEKQKLQLSHHLKFVYTSKNKTPFQVWTMVKEAFIEAKETLFAKIKNKTGIPSSTKELLLLQDLKWQVGTFNKKLKNYIILYILNDMQIFWVDLIECFCSDGIF